MTLHNSLSHNAAGASTGAVIREILRTHPGAELLGAARGYRAGERIRLDVERPAMYILWDKKRDAVLVSTRARGLIYVEIAGAVTCDRVTMDDVNVLLRERLRAMPEGVDGELPSLDGVL